MSRPVTHFRIRHWIGIGDNRVDIGAPLCCDGDRILAPKLTALIGKVTCRRCGAKLVANLLEKKP